MPQNPDQGSEPLVGDALMQADDATFAAELGLDIGTEAAVPADQPRDTKGRFTPRETPATETAEEAVIAEAVTEPAPEEPETPEAPETPESPAEETEPEAETPAEPEKPKPLTTFTVRDAEGVEVEAPDLRFAFKAGGKDLQDVPVDKLVRWAQSGFHVERVTQEATELRQRVPQMEQQLNERVLELGDQRALNERLLSDPEFYARAQEQWTRANTPEQVLSRQQVKLAEERERFEQQVLQQEAGAFLQNVTLPRVQALHQQYPTVTEKEIVAMLSLEMLPLSRNGRVPRESWNEALRLLDGPVREYVEAQHNVRDGVRATAETTARTSVTRAQEEATKAKRQLARVIAPASNKSAPPSPKPITSLDDAAESVAEDVLAAIRGG